MSGNIWQTMKTLYLLRHAKSSWDDGQLSDFERPLNERGRQTAPFIGELMRERGLVPEVVVSSPAIRARQTAGLVADSAALGGEVLFDERIYEASPHRLLDVVMGLDDGYGSAMLVGHNPGIEGFIRYLSGDVQPMPTAGLAKINLDTEHWADTSEGLGKLEVIIRPKDELLDRPSKAR